MCQLPEDLPTSLEGTFGSIRYAAIVTINVPIWPDKIFEKVFTVIKPVNLNEMFELKVNINETQYSYIEIITMAYSNFIFHKNVLLQKDSISVEKRKEFYVCCLLFCFKTLPLNIVAKLPATGFTPGQRIDLILEVENQSSKNVKNFKVEFFKVKCCWNLSMMRWSQYKYIVLLFRFLSINQIK